MSEAYYKNGMLLEVTGKDFELKTPMTKEEQQEWLGQRTTCHDEGGEPWLIPRWNYTHVPAGSKVLVMNVRPGISRHLEVMVENKVGLVERHIAKRYSTPVIE